MEELSNVNIFIELGKTIISLISFILAYIALRKAGKTPQEATKTASEIANEAKLYGEEKANKYFIKQCKKHHINTNEINNEEIKENEETKIYE